MEEKITLTKAQLRNIITTAYESGLHEEENFDLAMHNLSVAYSIAGIAELMPDHVRYYSSYG